MGNIVIVEKILGPLENAEKFYPNEVANQCGLSLTFTLTILNELVNLGKLKLRFEIKDNGKLLTITDNYAPFLDKRIPNKNENFSLNNVFPVYYLK